MVSRKINDNYCVLNVAGVKNSVHVSRKKQVLNPSPVIKKSETVVLHVNSFAANVHSVTGLPQKKGVNPNYCCTHTQIKHVNDVSCIGHLSSVNSVTNVPTVVTHPPVGARLQQFWEKWEALGSSPKVVTMLREGYTLPFRFRPNLTRSPVVISNYVNPQRQSHLLEALNQLTNKNVVEPVANQNSLGFYNRLFLVPKPNNRWRPILDLSTLNTFLNTELFKMETPETIRTSLQVGEWVTSIDFKDAYFHIPFHSQSRKYMCFHIQGQSYQFKALPFVVYSSGQRGQTEALQRGIRTHQYLDDWLVRATSHQTCLQHTQTLVALCRELGWLVNEEKSELEPKQVFNFVGYQFDLREGKVRPTPERWHTLTDKILSILSGPAVHVPHRTSNSHRKTSPPRSTSHETHTVALEKQLESTRVTGKGDTRSQVTPPSPKMVAGGKQCSSRSAITPSKICSANLYRRIKRRVGRSLKRAHCKGNLVSSRKQIAHKSPGTKSGLSGLKRVPGPLFKQHSPGSHRQHNSGCLYQQSRGG